MGTRVVTGTYLALVSLPADPAPPNFPGMAGGLTFPSQAASRIPGYLKVGVDRVALSFARQQT